MNDTIAAIATSPGPAGIAVIRVSGPDSLAIADRVFSGSGLPLSRRPPGTFVYGHITGGGRRIDEVIVLVMRGPHSYTGEDVVEIQGHGGALLPARLLETVIAAGARLADPGEFTKRAFLNGRLDLVQAEAVMDLIHAQSERSANAAMEQLRGILSRSYQNIYDDLLRICAEAESTLDFSDDDPTPEWIPSVIHDLRDIQSRIQALLQTAREGHVLRDGLSVVISGKPNVGKSTLFNALLGKNRAIVSPIPGTTRDTIEESLVIGGMPLRLIDTAGLRSSDCEVEREGVNRAYECIASADFHIHVIDISKAFDNKDIQRLSSVNESNCLIVLNKIDLGINADIKIPCKYKRVVAQLIYNQGITEILEEIRRFANNFVRGEPHAVISSRHKCILQESLNNLILSVDLLNSNCEDMIFPAVSHIRLAADSIGKIIGKVYTEDLLESIFSKFCIGK